MKFLSNALATIVLGTVFVATTTYVAPSHADQPQFVIETQSPLGFKETLAKLEANAKAIGWKVPKRWKINFQKNLKHVTGRDIGKTRVIGMCAPESAADILERDELKKLTAMMPCNIAVYEKSDGRTYISMLNMEALGEIYGDVVKDAAAKLAPQLKQMLILK